MDIYAKIRTLAQLDPTLSALFFTGVPRWFKQRIQPGYINKGLCVRVSKPTTVFGYTQYGLMNLNKPLMQFDVMGFDSTAVQAATIAVINWMGTVSFAETNDFDSPATTPPHSPNFLLNRRSGMEAQEDPPGPVYIETLDFRIYNLEN